MLTSSDLQRIYEDAREAATHGTLHDDHVAGLRAVVEAALAAAPQGEWVMVPREPTREMTRKGQNELVDSCRSDTVYRAMIAAAPPAPAAQPSAPIATVVETAGGPKLLVAGVEVTSWLGCMHEPKAHKIAAAVNAALAAQPSAEPVARAISVDALSKMVEPLDGIDSSVPAYQWRKGWNDALRRAMDYAQPSAGPSELVRAARDALAWMTDPQMSTWRYLEGADLHGDIATHADALRRALDAVEGPGDARDAGPVGEVLAEAARATRKFPTWPSDPLHAVAVLGEEFGELTKAVLQLTYEPHKTSASEVRTEAVQTAAMALRFLASLDRYVYAGSDQHEQHEMGGAPEAKEGGRG